MAVDKQQQPEPIAIVGSGCRFPGGASSPSALWKLLEQPRDVRSDIGPDRFDAKTFFHPDGAHHGTSNVLQSYLLAEDVRVFDAAFFNLSPAEADSMDPQQRLLLETVYEALESGGHTLDALRGTDTAVYVGTMTADYNDTLIRDHNTMPKYFATGTNRAIISNRVSYFFDWHGPSMTIDTACSSSLVAVHQGVSALRGGESRVAVACGTQVLLNPEMYIGESKLKMLSPNGRSAMWDESADGYARGEGVAAIVLKKLSDAIADGDHIECLIRETGANQDGFSNGITVPNSDAQALLIRQTYARAGLDPENEPLDRPQFFEAHGTGTQAGDPKEAAAIHDVFGKRVTKGENPLYVGSVKTVIGHLEGCAGLAGLLKGSVMIQSGHMAPNLHFHNLNPKINPFFSGVRVPTELTPWPTLPEHVPRRVSVNSFGFGGTNAHAILEEYKPSTAHAITSSSSSGVSFSPFVFSAQTEASLVSQLQAYSAYLKTDAGKSINPADLAWTLHSRRTQHAFKAAFPALSIEQLASTIDAKLEEVSKNASNGATVGLRSTPKPLSQTRLLGVFTGQGAQWPAMGAHLIRTSAFARDRIQFLEDSLSALPEGDRPQWSLRTEMLAGADTSRIAEAALSQPLCTAIQVVLIDLLRSAGITFAAVVGHSSGEIAAAYAAGFLSARDAIRIAYYRGLYAKFAGNEATGQKGGMMAVGASWDEAQALCNSPQFKGRLAVAAHNSPASVTLSGDQDAVNEAKKQLDGEKKFARLLKVDTAYHSHHMLPCGDRYVASLKECGVKVIKDRKDTSTVWFSSVTGEPEAMTSIDELQDEYWRDNMTGAVLFSEAVKNAINQSEHIDLAIEVGPHPALKGPATQNVAEVRTAPLPYTGVLSRGKNDIESFAAALGFIWTQLPHLANFAAFDKFATQDETPAPKLVKGLPKYQWNHARSHWAESRISRRMRTRKQPHHEILGFLSPDANGRDMRWLNVLKQKEIPWLDGHQLQGQTVFPAAGYVAMAVEASRRMAGDRPVELFELHNLVIPRAITFEEGTDSLGVETLVTLTGIEHHQDDGTATADFAVYSVPVLSAGSEQDMEMTASGRVRVVFGTPDVGTLSVATPESEYGMVPVDSDLFYNTISELGYNYSGPFKTLSASRRKLNQSWCEVDSYAQTETDVSDYLVHPSWLDVAFQASMLAYSAPGDDRLWSLSVPTAIGTIRVNPEVCATLPTSSVKIPVFSTIDPDSEAFSASIDLLSEGGEYGMVQVEDLALRPFAPATAADDRVMFTHVQLGLASPDGAAAVIGARPSSDEVQLAAVCERIAYFYIRKWQAELGSTATGKQSELQRWVDQTLGTASRRGQHPTLKREWANDSLEDIQALVAQYAECIDVKLLTAIGQDLPAAVRGVVSELVPSGLLKTWYQEGLGFSAYNSFLAGLMKQIVHRYPHARILEVGAGEGAASKAILEAIGDKFSSYTYTDVSDEAFANAQTVFRAYSEKMSFMPLNLEEAVAEQGFKPASFDIVIASHALASAVTSGSLQTALDNVRELIKPGGYLLLSEITGSVPVRCQSILQAVAQGPSPLLTPGEWHSSLRKAGFSGVDVRTPDIDSVAWPMSVMVSQAVDEKVRFLRRPLSSPTPSGAPIYFESLVVLGNGSLESQWIGEQVIELLERFCGETTVLSGLPTEDEAYSLNPQSTFINLVDLDAPIFQDVTDEKMDGLKRVLELAKQVLWITHGGHQDKAYQTASIAFGRSIRQEAGHIGFSAMDLESLDGVHVPKAIAEYLLEQTALGEWGAPPSALANQEHFDFSLFWSREPEVFLTRRGQVQIPRLLVDADKNSRLNSSRRVITKSVPIASSNVAIVSSTSADSPYFVVEQVGRASIDDVEAVKVQSSSLKALSVASDTFLFLGIGAASTGDTLQAVLSLTNSSKATSPVVTVDVPCECEVDVDSLLVAVASELLADSLIEGVSSRSRLLVHVSGKEDRSLAAAVSRAAAKKDVMVSFSTEAPEDTANPNPNPTGWIHLSARAPNHVVRNTLRRVKPTHFLNLSSATDLSKRIAQNLPANATAIDSSALFRRDASLVSTSDVEVLESKLQAAVSCATAAATELELDQVRDLLVTPLGQLRTLNAEHATSAVHWPQEADNELVEVEVRPLDGRQLFGKNKTYLLVGLSGQIGQSLAEWMVANGAGAVVLTSRRPKVDQRWLDSFAGTGAVVKTMALDVLDIKSVESVVSEIRATLPPIAGVANGAVIFDDQLFANMTGATMRKVLGAKVDGSNNLDDVFYNDDLDFFVLFSSAVCVFGNAGQSNYAAANGYLNGLARQRRARGLAASAIDLGRVAGVGYVEAAGQAVVEQLVKKLGLPPVGETDLRQLIAETILAGFPTPADKDGIPRASVTTGLRVVGDDEDLRGPWFSNSFFAHVVKETRATSGANGGDNQASLPVSQRLPLAADETEALEILKESFANKLRVMLQLGDQKIEHDAPLLELGIDSLVAVEVRSWFLKELKVDIPVLKIVGGASLAELCQQALKKLPADLLPGQGGGDKQEAAAVPAPAAPAPAPKAEVAKPEAPVPSPELPTKLLNVKSVASFTTTIAVTPVTQASPVSLTPATTPSSPRSVADPTEAEPAKPTPVTAAAPKNLKFLKSERISLPQSRFWFLRHLLEDPTTPNVVFSYRVTGNLRVGDLERAIRLVTNRHEALRTCFVEDENKAGEAFQKVLSSSPLRLERKKITSAEDVDVEYNKMRAHVFDLEHGDTMKLMLLSQTSSSHYLLINYHHIVMDGHSFNIFLADLEKAYSGQSLGPMPRQYPEFSAAQRKALDNGEMSDELKYWQSVFPAGEQPPVLPLLPMARSSSRTAMKDFDSYQVVTHLEPELVARIKAVSKAARSTPFHLHLAAFKSLLFAFAGEETQDLTIGIADAARNESDLAGSLGFFLNLLTLRFKRQPEQSFADAVSEARNITYGALGTSRLPFDVLLSELNITRSNLHSPFFQAFLDYRQGIQERMPWGNCEFEFNDVYPGRTAYDITLDVTEWSADDTLVMIRVQKSLYDLTAANLLLETYVHFVDVLTKDASLTLKDTPLFGEKQLAQAVTVGRGPNLVSDWPGTLPLRIDQITEQNKDKVALMDGTGKVLTYADMANRIQAISEALQKAGVASGCRVLVYQQPAADWTCSMLAIMRIGAVYVPLDLRNPMVRLAAVAKDCAPKAVLADSTTMDEAPQLSANAAIINVTTLPLAPSTKVANVSTANSPAAILYTSGSTGTPKGIQVTHAGLRNEIEGYTKTWGLKAERVLQQSAFTFNHSSDQMYTGLVNGGMVYIVPAEKRGDPVSITQIMVDQGITYTKATPSEYSLWIQFAGETLKQATNWRFAFGGGEQLTSIVTNEFASLNLPNLKFFNSYGPTEISISSHKMEMPYNDAQKIEAMGRIACGYSLPNYYTYVVDEHLKPVAVGMPGEVCLGGAGVSLGYLNNPELTAKHFVENPFATEEDKARGWTRMYRTNDIGHLQQDGAMVFRARMAGDSQVKIRGLRIELSDIESNIVICSGGALKEAVVTLRDADGPSPFLVAHVTFAAKHSVTDKDAFLADLLARLPIPQYMIPVVAIPLDKFPLSNHNKVDRKAVAGMPLPEKLSKDGNIEEETELTETMVQLKHVWHDVLGKNLDKFGFDLVPSTNFFNVGGNSLLVIRLQAKIRKVFQVAVPLIKLLGASTLGEMARKIEESAALTAINWDAETALSAMPNFLDTLPPKAETGKKTVLVTGATGFLGRHIVPQLAERADIDKIHCIAVRDKPRDDNSRLLDHPKIAYHVGDLGLPYLGLSVNEFRTLAGEADVILHMGAVRSFWDNYHVLRPSNVAPVKELVKLAAPRHVPIHYISTVGVLGNDNTEAVSAAANLPPTDGSEGYVASKWAGERILERAAAELGVPSKVYRFLPHNDERGNEAKREKLIDDFVKYTELSGLKPDMSVWRGRVDLIPVQELVEVFGDAAASNGAVGGTVEFTHYESPVAIRTDELSALIEKKLGEERVKELESIPVIKWFGRIKALGFAYLLAAQEATVGAEGSEDAYVSRR